MCHPFGIKMSYEFLCLHCCQAVKVAEIRHALIYRGKIHADAETVSLFFLNGDLPAYAGKSYNGIEIIKYILYVFHGDYLTEMGLFQMFCYKGICDEIINAGEPLLPSFGHPGFHGQGMIEIIQESLQVFFGIDLVKDLFGIIADIFIPLLAFTMFSTEFTHALFLT